MIEVKDLCYTYAKGTPYEITALKDIDFRILPGEWIGLIGHTGSGKSTLIQHLNGLLKPTSGKVFIDGIDIWQNKTDIKQVRFMVGLVFQYPEYQLFEETVFKDIAFGPTNMGLPESEIKERVYEAMSFVGLPQSMASGSPFALSGGQKRRVAIAGVIAMRPKVLILDEPTAGLDPIGRKRLLEQLYIYHQQTNSAILFISHNMEDIASYAQKVMVLHQGTILAFDKTQNIFSQSEKLKAIGLDVPPITEVFHQLKMAGIPVAENIFTLDQAEEELKKLLMQTLPQPPKEDAEC